MARLILSALIAFTALHLSAQYTATVKTTVVKKESTEWRSWSDASCTMNFPSLWVAEGSGPNDRVARFLAPDLGDGGTPEQVEVFIRDAGSADLATAAAALERSIREEDSSAQISAGTQDGVPRTRSTRRTWTTGCGSTPPARFRRWTGCLRSPATACDLSEWNYLPKENCSVWSKAR